MSETPAQARLLLTQKSEAAALHKHLALFHEPGSLFQLLVAGLIGSL